MENHSPFKKYPFKLKRCFVIINGWKVIHFAASLYVKLRPSVFCGHRFPIALWQANAAKITSCFFYKFLDVQQCPQLDGLDRKSVV